MFLCAFIDVFRLFIAYSVIALVFVFSCLFDYLLFCFLACWFGCCICLKTSFVLNLDDLFWFGEFRLGWFVRLFGWFCWTLIAWITLCWLIWITYVLSLFACVGGLPLCCIVLEFGGWLFLVAVVRLLLDLWVICVI